MALRAILFDLDGTLIATRRLYVEAFSRALEPYVGLRLSETEIMSRKPRAERRFLREIVGPEHAPECLERFYEHFEALHSTHFQGVYEGVPELLAALRSRGVPLGLVTGKSRRAWRITREHVELGSFHVEVLDDDVPDQKPDPSGVRQAVSALNVAPEEVVYVGDSLTDVEAARGAGVRAGAVLWCKKEEERDRFRREAEAMDARILPRPESVVELPLSPGP